jgi:hypothetical protein
MNTNSYSVKFLARIGIIALQKDTCKLDLYEGPAMLCQTDFVFPATIANPTLIEGLSV